MKNYSKILLAISMLMILSCNSERNKYEGNWEISSNGSVSSIISIQTDSAITFNYGAFLCDTFITKEHSFKTFDRFLSKDSLLLGLAIENETLQVSLNLSSNESGKLCSKGKCLNIERLDKVDVYSPSDETRQIQGWKYELANEIIKSQREFDSISSFGLLSETALNLIEYIDLTRQNLLSQFGVEYEATVCWQRVDSLLAYKLSTEILIGEEPGMPKEDRFSGRSVGLKLFKYLGLISSSSEVKVIFPEYTVDGFVSMNSDGQVETWEIGKFYHRPLGLIIAELNTLKIKVAQLEIIRTERKTTR